MSELTDYTQPKVVPIEQWIKRSGVYTGQALTLDELTKLLKAYRGYIYEAELRPAVSYKEE